MLKRFLIFSFFLLSCLAVTRGQHFDRLHDLIRERESIKAAYDKLNGEVKASKSKKPSVELQAAIDNLLAKDSEILQELSKTESAVNVAIVEAGKKERIKTVIRGDKSQNVIIDSLYSVVQDLQTQRENLLAGHQSSSSFQSTLENELKTVAGEKASIQKELDSVKTDKFILARRNWILLYFNLGIAVLLTIGLIYMVATFRKKRKPADAVANEGYILKPRPITGFNQQVHKVAFDAFDSRLEKIEMLGKLREKGLITDEEFLMQKQQLLNTKNKE